MLQLVVGSLKIVLNLSADMSITKVETISIKITCAMNSGICRDALTNLLCLSMKNVLPSVTIFYKKL